jgi:ABC-2 type transport system permease protein
MMQQQPRKIYSQWIALLAITKASLRSITRSPSSVIFTIGFPLVFIVAFGFIKSNRIKLDVGVDSRSDTTSSIFHAFSSMPNVSLEPEAEKQQMLQQLNKGRIDAILYIHRSENTGASRVVEVITSQASREKGMFVKSILTNIIDKQNIALYKSMGATGDSIALSRSNILSELKETEAEGREYKMIDFILPGQLGFSILSAGVFGTAFVFFSLRQTLVLKRFFATPVKRTFIILGEALSRLIFQLCGSLVLIIIGRYAFGFTLINGWITLCEMLVLSALGLIVFMGFGFVVSGLARTESVIPPIANVITLPQFLLSGTFFPVEAFPNWLQIISKSLPLTYLNDALRKVAFEGASLVDVSSQIGVVALWGIAIYFAAVKFFRWE